MNIIILGLTSLLTDISTEMVYPLLPMFLTQTLGASPAILGLIEGIAESVASFLRVFSGYISDRLGRRKPLAIAVRCVDSWEGVSGRGSGVADCAFGTVRGSF